MDSNLDAVVVEPCGRLGEDVEFETMIPEQSTCDHQHARVAGWRRVAAAAVLTSTFGAGAADFENWVAESSKVVVGGVEYAVVDVYAEFVQSGVQVVNAYDATISSTRQTVFFQNDLNTYSGGVGTWNPSQSLELPSLGLTAANDSFV
ncbi:MAG: hypothetical protein ACYTF3_07270, partial [Planctomycetota bacterium]